MKAKLPCLTALLSIVVFPHILQTASPPTGAVVQDSHYDAAKRIVTFSILNVSHKDITALNLQVRVIHPDGTLGIIEHGGDFLPFMVYLAGESPEGRQTALASRPAWEHDGAFASGAVFSMDVPLGQEQVQSASATADVVIYADYTAEMVNENAFNSIVSQRKGLMLGLQKADELLQNALADPSDAHPSITVAAELRVLAKQYEANPPPNGDFEGIGLLYAATDISNAPKSPTGRSQKEDDYLRALVKTHQTYISLLLPHTWLTKMVQHEN